ncbi:MAG: RagB/SusD family nutrient uptake outer membrane protein, partial [Prevotellaceae bacterium]|nr:RagB/SusD family nutrient uptake outer membrane protein [Prevotellaceae bacterium]
MKKISKISLLLLIAVMCFTSCNKYLDIVPDHIAKVEDLFTTKADAKDALAKIYSYLPALDNIHETPYLLGDEYVSTRSDYDYDSRTLIAQRVMRDLQSSGAPLLGLWSGTGGTGEGGVGKHYYVAMRHCDMVMEYVDLVFDMTDSEKKEFRAQVKFLKAYFAFILIQQYGPIVIPQYLDTDETDPAKLFPPRVGIDESFDYVINLMKEAIPDLRTKVMTADYGQVDQTVAKSILARVYVFRASPFYNGNSDLFGSFRNIDGSHFFPQEYKKEKWKDAIDALDDAITTCT